MAAVVTAFLADLRTLVAAESKTGDLIAVDRCARVLATIGSRLLGPAARLTMTPTAAGPVVQWRFGRAPWRLALVGHYDTAHPAGTLSSFPYEELPGLVRGPGTHDMKAGVLTILYGCAALLRDDPAALDGVVIHVCPDEEEGSVASMPALGGLIDDGLTTALVYEGADEHDGLVTSRRGGLWVDVAFTGSDAHGSRPQDGANALQALAEFGAAIPSLADPARGTTVVLTRAIAGTTINTAPGRATLTIDCRTETAEEQQRVLDGLTAIYSRVPGVTHDIVVLHRFPPMAAAMSAPVYHTVSQAARRARLAVPAPRVGAGISDASHLSALGVHVLDGLGPRGGGDHSSAEWVDLASIATRIALTAAIVGPVGELARTLVVRQGAGVLR
jgi:glutamate carboxypeptidase